MEEKRDIQGLVVKYEGRLAKLPRNKGLSAGNKTIILNYLKDAELGKTIKNGQKKKIGKARLYRCAGILQLMATSWLKKDLDKVTEKDMEDFIRKLESGKIKNNRGQKYTSETQATIKKFVKKFYKYLNGGYTYPETVAWIDTTSQKAVILALTPAEVDDLMDGCGNLRDKIIVQLLFDSGCRIEEFLNLKLSDIVWKDGYYTLNVRYSKTKPRVISVAMSKSTQLLNKWLEKHPEAKNPDAYLIDMTYHNVQMMLSRLGQKILKKRVFPHLFRHTSMTFYANKLQHYPFNKRFGLAMSSDVADRYIDAAGITEETTAKIIKSDEVFKIEEENQKLKHEMNLLKEQVGHVYEFIEKSGLRDEILRKATGR